MEMMLALAGSSVLYHLIPMEHAITALKNDRFKLAATNEGAESKFGKAQYFLSLARSKHSAYFKANAGDTHVIFVIDGQKLNANYQVKPIDFWEGMGPDDEKEDRLFADKMYVPCIRYIKEIHFMKESPKWKVNDSLTLALLAKRAGIPLFQYASMNAFRNLDKRHTIKLEVSDKPKRKFGETEWAPGADYTLEGWYDAAQMVFRGDEDREAKLLQNADHKEQRKSYRHVAKIIKTLNKYAEVPDQNVRDFNTLAKFAKLPVELENLEKIKRIKRRLRLDTKGFLDYVRKRWMTSEERHMHGLE
jgi:hypothetical protein|uniref:Uncharacterized protein n=1 Tax=Myoviridae sp. ctshb19 TaxID=2825194 RepID=A0A8S5UH08_9CAUD|nr:MAG TPA: hypothetical protein [Myoviridae sp. ctshb19]